MEKKNKLSLWLGRFQSEAALKQYVALKLLTEKELDAGISSESVFAQHFISDYFIVDLLESKYHDFESDRIKDLLVNISYSEQLQSLFSDVKLQKKYNSCILLLDYEYDGHMQSDEQEDYDVDFVGTGSYDPGVMPWEKE